MSRLSIAGVVVGVVLLAGALVTAVLIDRRQRNDRLRERARAACAVADGSLDTLAGADGSLLFGDDAESVVDALRSMGAARCEALIAQLTPYGSTDALFDAPPNPPEQVRLVNEAMENAQVRCRERMDGMADDFELGDEERAELRASCDMEGFRPLRTNPRSVTLTEAVETMEAFAERLSPPGEP